MNSKLTRIIAIASALTMTAGIMTGCGSSSSSGAASSGGNDGGSAAGKDTVTVALTDEPD